MDDLYTIEVYHPPIDADVMSYPEIRDWLIDQNDHLIRSTPSVSEATWHSRDEAEDICRRMNSLYHSEPEANGGFITYHFKAVQIPLWKRIICKKMHDVVDKKRKDAAELYARVCQNNSL